MRSTPAHTWPQFENAPQRAPSTARPRLASARTSIGSLPPSSSVTGRRSSAQAMPTRRPTAVEPVNTTFATPGARTSASPRSSRTRAASTPSRRRASSVHSAHRACASAARATTFSTAPGSVTGTEPTTSSVAGFSERSSPLSTSCSGAAIARPSLSLEQSGAAIEIDELSRDPGAEIVLADVRPDALDPLAPLGSRKVERGVDRLRLPRDVERVHGQRPLAELLVHPRVLRQDQHAVALVHERGLLRDEVETVVDRVHEQRVELLVGGHRLREVVADLEVDRRPALALESVVHIPRRALDRPQVLGVLRDVLPRRVEQGQHRDAPVHLRVLAEVELERAEAADDVLRRIGTVDAQDEELRP